VRNDDLERGRSLVPAAVTVLVPAAVTVLVTALVVLAGVGSGAVGAPQAVERPGTTPGIAASTGIDAGPVETGRDGVPGTASEAVTARPATGRPAMATAAVAPSGFTPGNPSPANLLANPGCEAAGETGAPDGWTDQSPNGRSVYCTYVDGADDDGTDLTTQRAPEGPLGIADGRPDGETKVLVQTVPVTAGRAYEVAGWVGTDDALSSADYGEVEVRYLDGSGAPIGTAVTRSSLRSDTDDAFDRFSAVSTAPAGAASAQVRLAFVNADATGHAAVFFDGLTVRRTGPGPTASDDLLSVAVGGSLSPAATLFADSGHGIDRRGGSAATVASFGGGDLGGTVGDTAAGSTVPLAGGTLTVNADGSLVLREPVVTGTYAFRYRLSNGAGSDDATVRIRVANVSRNLLGNAGCELHGRADRPVGWTDESGTRSVACLDLRGGSFTAQDQPAGAYAIGDRDADGANESIVRTVRVSPGRTYVLSGHVGTDAGLSSTDGARVELRFLDGAGSVIAGEGVALADLRSATDESHSPFEGSATAPPGAERARVRVVLVDGDGGHADAFVDDVSLAAAPVLPDARDDGPFGVDLGGSLAPSASLLADNGNGSDAPGIPAGTVVGFGGGDLGGTVTDNAPGSTVPLAGGDLTVTADGSLSLSAPTEGGTYAFDYRLASSAGSDDATAFVAVRAPEITVLGNGTEVASGDATPSRADGTDLGAVAVEGGTAIATFEVRNEGLRELVLDGRTPVNVTGPNADEFAVTAQPATTVPAGGSTTGSEFGMSGHGRVRDGPDGLAGVEGLLGYDERVGARGTGGRGEDARVEGVPVHRDRRIGVPHRHGLRAVEGDGDHVLEPVRPDADVACHRRIDGREGIVGREEGSGDERGDRVRTDGFARDGEGDRAAIRQPSDGDRFPRPDADAVEEDLAQVIEGPHGVVLAAHARPARGDDDVVPRRQVGDPLPDALVVVGDRAFVGRLGAPATDEVRQHRRVEVREFSLVDLRPGGEQADGRALPDLDGFPPQVGEQDRVSGGELLARLEQPVAGGDVGASLVHVGPGLDRRSLE